MRVRPLAFLRQWDSLVDFSSEDLVVDCASGLISGFLITYFSVAELFDQILAIAEIVVTFVLSRIVSVGDLSTLYFSTCVLPFLSCISNLLISCFISQIFLHQGLKVVSLLIMPIVLSILVLRALLLP